ncbi:TrkH family potassium uptake protein [Alteromonas confluentis]|uniref:Ktr system potassium transporter B n=1 Tax=Alteromonas confluentis TaxID=1656094 RepID=A0A1E7ZEU7_9ALTE|nr:TrkH family potassium uptake protein [Alteromonas confluentis]OFC72029.1 Ktr system potassium transporter B [Alteromonas confluentis]
MKRWLPGNRPLERKPRGSLKIQAAPPLILSLSFLGFILLGTVLLKLPFATTAPISWVHSLFTATSAVTVTGLAIVDTGTGFTLFGQMVIAGLIQFGGLGLMTFAVVTLVAIGSKISFLQQSAVKEAFNETDTSSLVSTAKAVILFALAVEAIGILVLSAYWQTEMGWKQACYEAFFYTISAFNNAGFALSSDSLSAYVNDPVVNITITALFITGGLGFSVWIDLVKKKKWQMLTPYSKTMLLGTLIINVAALLLIYLIEYDNPETLGKLDAAGKWWASWFQAVTPRTAGFNTLDINALEDGSVTLMLLLMFIGGGSMSTASGIKVVTFVVLLTATYNFLRREHAPTLFQRTIRPETVSKALALTVISAGVTWIAIFVLTITETAPFIDIVFEAVSALGTVGLSRGLTGDLSAWGEGIIIVLMFLGRLGPLTLAYLLASPRQRRVRFPDSRLSIG